MAIAVSYNLNVNGKQIEKRVICTNSSPKNFKNKESARHLICQSKPRLKFICDGY